MVYSNYNRFDKIYLAKYIQENIFDWMNKKVNKKTINI